MYTIATLVVFNVSLLELYKLLYNSPQWAQLEVSWPSLCLYISDYQDE